MGGGGVVILSTPVQYLCMCLWQLPSKWRTSLVALKGPFHVLHARSASLAFSPSFIDALVALDTVLILPFKCYACVLKLCACGIGGPGHTVAHRPQSSSPFHKISSSSSPFHKISSSSIFHVNILNKLLQYKKLFS